MTADLTTLDSGQDAIVRRIALSELLGRPVAARDGQALGRVADVIVRLHERDYPPVTGLVVTVGGRRGPRVFVPLERIARLAGPAVTAVSASLDVRPFERRQDEVLLRADVLGHRLIDVHSVRFVRARDRELESRNGAWTLCGVDVQTPGRLARALHRHGAHRVVLDWSVFEPLVGHAASSPARRPSLKTRRFKAAQIADLLEDASKAEESELLDDVHTDPELEADVFEELNEDLAARLLGARTDAQIAEVLSRMGADDAADAVADLPQHRRAAVLDLLPTPHRRKVLALLGFNPTSAGGLMGVDLLALPPDTSVSDALATVAADRAVPAEALGTVHLVDATRRLIGTVQLLALLKADPGVSLGQVADLDPVRTRPDADIEDVAILMADYNLITVPVTDDEQHLVGVITVDDLLEAVIPIDWRRRETPAPTGQRPGFMHITSSASSASAESQKGLPR